MGAIRLAISNNTDEEYGGTFVEQASNVAYDNTTSGLTADDVQDAIDEVNTILSNTNTLIANMRQHIPFYTTYPNGHQAGQSTFLVTIPCMNPSSNSKVDEAYVYDANGNWTDIKSAITGLTARYNCVVLTITFNSSLAGKMLRIELTIA